MEGFCMLYAEYFADDPLHVDVIFRRHFRMSQKLFLKIVENLREINYFKLKRDSIGLPGFSTIEKYTVALRMLPYGMPGDTHDAIFGNNYPHTPNAEDTFRILIHNIECFLGCLEASTVYNCTLKNYPFAHQVLECVPKAC
ncbi:uncharacterized protein [Lolium perenne]|uniref:uncharacterized protein n=1 Tax=Lolium perenne TaxID=4522 RepID=UPI0021F642D1|nr:uncharacterized protein LOC127340255 [Lolium perenne]